MIARASRLNAAVAQSVERRIGSAEDTGPIPVSSSFEKRGNLDKYKVSTFFVCLKNVDSCRQLSASVIKPVKSARKSRFLLADYKGSLE